MGCLKTGSRIALRAVQRPRAAAADVGRLLSAVCGDFARVLPVAFDAVFASAQPQCARCPQQAFAARRRGGLSAHKKRFGTSSSTDKAAWIVYTGKRLHVGGYGVEHFIPYQFVAHDRMWNLIPPTPASITQRRQAPAARPVFRRVFPRAARRGFHRAVRAAQKQIPRGLLAAVSIARFRCPSLPLRHRAARFHRLQQRLPVHAAARCANRRVISVFFDLPEEKVLFRTAHFFALADGFPLAPGHVLLVSNRVRIGWAGAGGASGLAGGHRPGKIVDRTTPPARRLQHRHELWRGRGPNRNALPLPRHPALQWRHPRPARRRARRHSGSRSIEGDNLSEKSE